MLIGALQHFAIHSGGFGLDCTLIHAWPIQDMVDAHLGESLQSQVGLQTQTTHKIHQKSNNQTAQTQSPFEHFCALRLCIRLS